MGINLENTPKAIDFFFFQFFIFLMEAISKLFQNGPSTNTLWPPVNELIIHCLTCMHKFIAVMCVPFFGFRYIV